MSSLLPSADLRDRTWKRFLRGPDSELLEQLYVPALARSLRYDRCCAYFSSTVLAAAARGFAGLIDRLTSLGESAPRPAVRLLVNEEIPPEDARALTERGDFSVLEAALRKRFHPTEDLLEAQRLDMLGWLASEGLLEVRVGIMRHGTGILHAKFGIMRDEHGNAVVFNGSGNESAQGLRGNYERLEVSPSWADPERYREYSSEFEALWSDSHPDVHAVSLPEAIRLELIQRKPSRRPISEPVNSLARQKATMLWDFALEAPYMERGGASCDATAMVDMWPHQRSVVEEASRAWPDGRLLCDEVGMGKTIEAILVLRRLLAGRGVKRVLILLPAGLLRQWQAELREKGGLIAPRLEGTSTLVWPDESILRIDGLADALSQDLLLLSRETARTEQNLVALLSAEPWDLVILDESHAARRREQSEGEFNAATLLLELLRELQLRRKTRGFLLLSATPMQTQPWEPWDLLQVLGEGGPWLAEFQPVRDYYLAIAAIRNKTCNREIARKASRLVAADPGFPAPPQEIGVDQDRGAISRKMMFPRPAERDAVSDWLRSGSPLSRRMHRNTRATLRAYYEMGLLPANPARRLIRDVVFDFDDPAERGVYDGVRQYIEKRFHELEREKPGKGFVMTIYSRRASSSPLALERSLRRRAEGLSRVAARLVTSDALGTEDLLGAQDLDDLGDFDGKVSAAFPADPDVARRELVEVRSVLQTLQNLVGRDTKRDRFFDEIRRATDDGRPVLVFSEYGDTLEYIRDLLLPHFGKRLGCYSGEGGQVWTGTEWKGSTKDAITRALRNGELLALVCTDAASEGLNLQAAGALINYDLPWNPSRIEQRIGRIDRIGQKYPEVRIVNLFLRNSVDSRVYQVLRQRCGLFEHFVGPMQPVLAVARRMLLRQAEVDPHALETAADTAGSDLMAKESYVESVAIAGPSHRPGLDRAALAHAFSTFDGSFGVKASIDEEAGTVALIGPTGEEVRFGNRLDALERDKTLRPLSPFDQSLRSIEEWLRRAGERLPLVIGTFERGAFRSAVALWVPGPEPTEIEDYVGLDALVQAWDGTYPDPAKWVTSLQVAQKTAERRVLAMEASAHQREEEAIARQRASARERLQREIGRYLAALDADLSDLNGLWNYQIQKDIQSSRRLRAALEKLGGFPEWDEDLVEDLREFKGTVSESQKRSRQMGKEIDAALEDPRWRVRAGLGE